MTPVEQIRNFNPDGLYTLHPLPLLLTKWLSLSSKPLPQPPLALWISFSFSLSSFLFLLVFLLLVWNSRKVHPLPFFPLSNSLDCSATLSTSMVSYGSLWNLYFLLKLLSWIYFQLFIEQTCLIRWSGLWKQAWGYVTIKTKSLIRFPLLSVALALTCFSELHSL